MLFNSMAYAIFLPIVFIVYWLLPQKFRWPLLLGVSYYFYMSWNPKYIILILLTTAVSYFAGLLIEGQKGSVKKVVLTITCIVCLGTLFIFKYFNFFTESISYIFSKISIKLSPVTVSLLLPVGISFYTFQTLSYVIDVYRGDIPAEKNFGVYATFISFFPQLVAGPIERSKNLLPQIKSEKNFDYDMAAYGLKLMAWGYFKKLAIADVISVYVDRAYANINTCTGLDLLIAVFFFTIQIYCDFSGYSDIAIGTAKLMGINLMTNFKSPYFSISIKEFWSRWHISLSTWFRDYVYIPLGGNRVSKGRGYLNLMVTFLVSGLWHGANYTYIVWGGIHGLFQIIEKMFGIEKKHKGKLMKLLSWIIVFGFCNFAWIFFRASSMREAMEVIDGIAVGFGNLSTFSYMTIGLTKEKLLFLMALITCLAVFDYQNMKYDVIEKISKQKTLIRWPIYIGIVVITYFIHVVFGVRNVSFVYFQF